MSARGKLIECLGLREAFLRKFVSCFLQVIPERCSSTYLCMTSLPVLSLLYTRFGLMGY